MAEYFLSVGTELKIQPQYSAIDYSYVVLDPGENGHNTNPIKVIMMHPDRKRFFKIADDHHVDQFRELKNPWGVDSILECIESSRADTLLSIPDAKTAVRWLHEGTIRPRRTISVPSSLIISAPRV